MSDVTVSLPVDTGARLAELARCWKGALRAVSLYPGQHPAIAVSLGRLVEAEARLANGSPVPLDIRPDGVLLHGAKPSRPDPALEELAELLHRHLIGRITIHAPDAASWRTLLRLLGRPPDEVRLDGGIARLWAAAGGPSITIEEIDYAEVLREKEGPLTSIDDIIAAILDGPQIELDEDALDALLAALADPAQVRDLIARLELSSRTGGHDVRAVAAMALLQAVVTRVAGRDAATVAESLRCLGALASHLTPEHMLRLLAQREAGGPEGDAVASVLASMEDQHVAEFVSRAVIESRGATARLAHAFQALVPDDHDRQRRILALAGEQVAASPLAEATNVEELWGTVESMVTSYTDANYVSEEYARELWQAQSTAVELERVSDDPPERLAAWIDTVSDGALRALDQQLLEDLLRIEPDPARWRDVAETSIAHAEALVRAGHFDPAWQLADAVIREAGSVPGRRGPLPRLLARFGGRAITRHVAEYLRSADDDAFARFQRLCAAIGPPAIGPLAEALSAEQDARSRRRLRDVLIGFGAQGRDVVQRLMQAPNWEVRRTAAFLLREFGGAEGLHELVPLLTDSEPLVQREALHALILTGTADAAALLVRSLPAMAPQARERLVGEFVGIRDPRASSFFCHLVRTVDRGRHENVYVAALDALGAFSDTESVETLRSALQRGEWWAPRRTKRARHAAAGALRRIGSPAALDALQGAAATGGRGVRTAARAHLPEAV